MNIELWFDFSCPFCYIGLTKLNRAIEKTNRKDINLIYRAFQLDPDLKDKDESYIEKIQKSYAMNEEERKAVFKNIENMGVEVGINFDFESIKDVNTNLAHRGMKFAINNNLQKEYAKKVYSYYFQEGKNINKEEELVNIAKSLGLDENEFVKFINSDEAVALVEEDKEKARRNAISLVPTFIINEEKRQEGSLEIEKWVEVFNIY